LITPIKSKLTSTQCATSRHWKSLSRVQDDSRGFSQRPRPEARGRISEGCNLAIVLSDQLVDENSPQHIPTIPPQALTTEETTDPTLPPPNTPGLIWMNPEFFTIIHQSNHLFFEK